MNTDDLINSLTEGSQKTKVAPRPIVIFSTWLIAATTYIIIFMSIMGFRSDIVNKLHEPIFLADITISAIIIIFAALTASQSIYPDLSRKKLYSRITISSIAILLTLMLWQSFTISADSNQTQIEHFSCATFICLFGGLPAALLFLLFSRGLCFTPSKTALSAGIASFMTGYLTLRLEEAQDAPIHILVYHLAPLTIMIAITYLLGKIYLRKRLDN